MAEHCIQEADFMQHMEARLEHFSLRGELENIRRWWKNVPKLFEPCDFVGDEPVCDMLEEFLSHPKDWNAVGPSYQQRNRI